MRLAAALWALVLAGCSGSTAPATKAKEPEKPLEPLTGRQAFQQLYPPARAWAPDCQPLEIHSIQLADVKAEPGKAGAWQITFVSQGRNRARVYTWSAIEAEGNLHKGFFAGLEESYSGPHGQARPFLTAALKIDTTEAYETAVKHSGDYLKKNTTPKPVNFLLEWTARFPNPAWRVLWGESAATSEYSVFVDASTGQYLEKVR